ncbi:MAG: hypothetical protein CME62_04245 [Halobacteriovoraceae bacterium]|nr:hypothetical protein [Halobacteriovoraceae bacterium]|tara:strand:+ start:4185 stop:4697 length:513 start_codon:yes stop_codon:yes gene_type:complete
MQTYLLLSLVLLSSALIADETTCEQQQLHTIELAELSAIAEYTEQAQYINYCEDKMKSNTFIFEEDLIYCQQINTPIKAACVASVDIHDDIFSPGSFEVEACAKIDNEYALRCVQALDFSDAFYGASYMEVYECAQVKTEAAVACVEEQPFGDDFDTWSTFLEVGQCAEK